MSSSAALLPAGWLRSSVGLPRMGSSRGPCGRTTTVPDRTMRIYVCARIYHCTIFCVVIATAATATACCAVALDVFPSQGAGASQKAPASSPCAAHHRHHLAGHLPVLLLLVWLLLLQPLRTCCPRQPCARVHSPVRRDNCSLLLLLLLLSATGLLLLVVVWLSRCRACRAAQPAQAAAARCGM